MGIEQLDLVGLWHGPCHIASRRHHRVVRIEGASRRKALEERVRALEQGSDLIGELLRGQCVEL